MKSTNKHIIDVYTTIYQIDIVVANKYTTLEELKELYKFNNAELNSDILDGFATTSYVKRKTDNQICILVKYNKDSNVVGISKKEDFINTISHEATHVALDIYDYIGQDICFCSPEPFAYLVGYATECIYKTLMKR